MKNAERKDGSSGTYAPDRDGYCCNCGQRIGVHLAGTLAYFCPAQKLTIPRAGWRMLYPFPRRTPLECDHLGHVTKYVPIWMQIRIWLGLPCKRCGDRLWLFSCRYGYCSLPGAMFFEKMAAEWATALRRASPTATELIKHISQHAVPREDSK